MAADGSVQRDGNGRKLLGHGLDAKPAFRDAIPLHALVDEDRSPRVAVPVRNGRSNYSMLLRDRFALSLSAIFATSTCAPSTSMPVNQTQSPADVPPLHPTWTR